MRAVDGLHSESSCTFYRCNLCTARDLGTVSQVSCPLGHLQMTSGHSRPEVSMNIQRKFLLRSRVPKAWEAWVTLELRARLP